MSLPAGISRAVKACQDNNLTELQECLLQGLPVDSVVPTFKYKNVSRTAVPLLCLTAAYNSLDCMSFLIKNGANVECYDKDNTRPVHYAVLFSNPAALHLLLQHKADPNPVTQSGVTPLLIAAKAGSFDCVKHCLDAGVNPNQQDGTGRTALHLVSWFNHSRLIPLLLQHNAMINVQDDSGDTPLHLACWFGHIESCHCLIDNKAPLDAQDKQMRTPLHFAVQHNRPAVVELLMQSGANSKLKNCNGKTPEQLAIAEDRAELTEIMQKYSVEEARSSRDGTLNEKEILDEHNRMKALVEKLVEDKDAQVESYRKLYDQIANNALELSALQEVQKDMREQIVSVQMMLQSILITMQSYSQTPTKTEAETKAKAKTERPSQRYTSLCGLCNVNPGKYRCKQCHREICVSCMESRKVCPFCLKK